VQVLVAVCDVTTNPPQRAALPDSAVAPAALGVDRNQQSSCLEGVSALPRRGAAVYQHAIADAIIESTARGESPVSVAAVASPVRYFRSGDTGYTDTSNAQIYLQGGTKASPVWKQLTRAA
jgi:hypothetical protein